MDEEGWAIADGAKGGRGKVYCYFRRGESLCRKKFHFGWLNPDALGPTCKACERALKKSPPPPRDDSFRRQFNEAMGRTEEILAGN